MRPLTELDRYRNHEGEFILYGPDGGSSKHGAFWIPFEDHYLKVIADSGQGWDHVSVSLPDRCPTWDEMSFVHRMLFKDDEAAFQLHVPLDDHINVHPYVLHLWRPLRKQIPMPNPNRV